MSSTFYASVVLFLAVLTAAEMEWPYAKPVAVAPPAVTHANRVRNGIDAFILRRLEAEQLTLAPEAAPRTLLRRLYLDLIGLPPSPAEVEVFLNDKATNAYENVVEKLLNDARYGERWARWWLDLARYADTAGYEGDPDLPHAWRYRDYVIDAFNNDKPYDLFIKEQIAGDEFDEVMGAGELPVPSPEQTVALTFLRLAPFTEPRGDETRHEMLSEMTSTVGSVFLGLTVGCAKCHDHKYDRIPTKDFYRLKAFFSTVQIAPPERGDTYQIGGSLSAPFYRKGEAEWAAQQRAELERLPKEFEDLKIRLESKLNIGGAGFGLQSFGAPAGNNYFYAARKVNDGQLHHAIANSDGRTWQFFTDGTNVSATGSLSGKNSGDWFGDIPAPAHLSLGGHTAGTGKPGGDGHLGLFAEIFIYDHPLAESERAQMDAYLRAKFQTGEKRTAPPSKGLRVWFDASDLDADPSTPNPGEGGAVSTWVDRIGGLRLTQDQAKLQPKLSHGGEAKAAAVKFEEDFLLGDVRGATFLSDQQGAIVMVFSAEQSAEGYGLEVGGNGAFISTVIYPNAKGRPDLDRLLTESNLVTADERAKYRELSAQMPFVKQNLKRLEPMAMSLRHSFGPPYEPGVPTSQIMIRGEYDHPGEVVEAGFPSGITGNQEPAAIRLDPFKRWPTRSRRMALAQWIASAENPLTARVLVNRLWYWHFGQGIVPTPSDFGKLSGGPSHPELLDWLALKFVDAKWSIKAVHRLIVTSSAYRQSAQCTSPRAEEIDPDNRLLWRFNRRRLEAEAVRDSILAVSGRLNPEQFGLPIFPPLPGDIAETVKYSESKWNTQSGAQGRKRSIYIYQQRTLTMPLMQSFDSLVCEESRPQRRSSVTPLQALALYNGQFANEEARYFAERVRKEAGDEPKLQVHRAFELALGRPPSEEESRRMMDLMAASKHGLTSLCRVLYNANEFVYID